MLPPGTRARPSTDPAGVPVDGRAAPSPGRRRRVVVGALLGVALAAAVVVSTLRVATAPSSSGSAGAGSPAAPADVLTRQIQGLQQHLKTDSSDYAAWATLGIDYIQQAKD